MRILHCADLHIDSPLRGLSRYEGFPADEVRGATRRAVRNLVRYAVDPANRIDVVTVGGDVFDGSWESADSGLWWNQQLGDLAEAGIEVFVVHGNHDADSKITARITPPAGVHVFGSDAPTTVEATRCNLVVHGQSYARTAVHEDLGSGYPAAVPGSFNMGLLHTSLDGRSSHAPYAPCAPADLALKGYEIWGLGHIHQRDDGIEVGGSRFVFPGNTQGRSIRETGAKGATVITVDDRGSGLSVEFVPFDVVRWTLARVDIGPLDSLDAVVHEVERRVREEGVDGHTIAVRVELVGAGRLHDELGDSLGRLETQLRATVGTLGGVSAGLERVIDTTTPVSGVGADSEAERVLRDYVRRAVEDPAVLDELVDVLRPAAQRLRPYRDRLLEEEWPGAIDSPEVVREHLDAALDLLLARLRGA